MQRTHVIGKLLVIDWPSPQERDWIFSSLAEPEIYRAMRLTQPPSRQDFDTATLRFLETDAVEPIPHSVRFYVLRLRENNRAVGFFIDTAWLHPSDSTRELSLAFPRREDRNAGTYYDANVIVSQFIFGQRLARRIRWVLPTRRGKPPRVAARFGGRPIGSRVYVDAAGGAGVEVLVYECTFKEFEALYRQAAPGPNLDYAYCPESLWQRISQTAAKMTPEA